MEHTYWHKQTPDQPLFPALLWSRPENRAHAGKLAIIGGNSFGFSQTGEAYVAVSKAGIGTSRVILPLAVRKIVGSTLEHTEFAASNPSGSFARDSLGEIMEHANWSDGILLPGDLGKNSETTILLESLLSHYDGPTTLANDAADHTCTHPELISNRTNTTLVTTINQLQKLVQHSKHSEAITTNMSLMNLVELLHDFTKQRTIHLVTQQHSTLIIASNGNICTMPIKQPVSVAKLAAYCSVWQIQNNSQPFEALTAAITELQ